MYSGYAYVIFRARYFSTNVPTALISGVHGNPGLQIFMVLMEQDYLFRGGFWL